MALLLSLTSSFVFAAETQQTLKPKSGQHELNIEGKYSNTSIPSNSQNISYENMAYLRYYYGLNDSNSIGLETSYKKSTHPYIYLTGTAENALKYKGNYNFQSFGLYYTAGYWFGLEDKFANYDSQTGNSAPQSSAIEFELGGVFSNPGFNFGFLFSNQLNQSGVSISQRSSDIPSRRAYTSSGGNGEVKQIIFIELDLPLHPNFEIGQVFFPDLVSTYTLGSGGTVTSTIEHAIINTYSLSGRWNLTERIQILPKIEQQTADTTSGNVVLNKFGATLRMLF